MKKLHGVALYRTRVFALYNQGFDTSGVVKQLCMRYHEKATESEAYSAYFKCRGGFMPRPEELEGAPREKLLEKLEHYINHLKQRREHNKRINSDSQIREKSDDKNRTRFKELWKSEEYRKQMASYAKTPEFREGARNRLKKRLNDCDAKEKFLKHLQGEAHRTASSERLKDKWKNDPEFYEKVSKLCSERTRKMNLENWANGDYRKKMLLILHSKEARDAATKTIRGKWENDAAFREKATREFVERMKPFITDPKFLKKTSKRTKNFWKIHPEFREKMSCLMLERWKDPEYRRMRSESVKQQWRDPKFVEKLVAGQICFWQEYRAKKQGISNIPEGGYGWADGTRVPISGKPEDFISVLILREDLQAAMGRLTPLQKAALADAYWLDVDFDASVLSNRGKDELKAAINEAIEILRSDSRLRAIYSELAAEVKNEGKTP